MIDATLEKVQALAKKFLPDEEFEGALQDAIKDTVLIIKEKKEKNILPHLRIYGTKSADGKRPVTIVGLTSLPDLEGRQEAFKMIGKKIATEADTHLMMLVFVSEAWTKEFSEEERKVFNKDSKRVSDYKDKKECIVAAGITLDHREKTIITLIDRDENRDIIVRSTRIPEDARNYLLRAFMQGYIAGENEKGQYE